MRVKHINLAADARPHATPGTIDSHSTALHHDGHTALLQNRPAASGARYVALDEQHSLRWHTKGSEGFLAFMAADHTAKEKVLLSDCRALPTP